MVINLPVCYFPGADSLHRAVFKKEGYLPFRSNRGSGHAVEVLREM